LFTLYPQFAAHTMKKNLITWKKSTSNGEIKLFTAEKTFSV
jgi:hypothetical protein